ncbi:MAG TPA: apolipoprotein N-acyltransferase [Armatimonadota bacterium]|nr:apolipoprotein N-acyltransferase [Armatimonadota bacterium]
MRTTAQMALCLASGLLLALAHPRAGLWPLAWVALVPWLTVAFTASRPVAVIGSLLAGFSFFGALMYWIAIFGYLPWALLALIEGLAFPLTAVVARIAAPRSPWRVPAVGIAWVTWEFARGQGRFGMPWGQVGHSQAPFSALAQLAAFGGVPAISFVVVVVNAALAHVIAARRAGGRRLAPLAGAIALTAAAVALGLVHAREAAVPTAPDARPPLRVALAQASVKTWLTVEALNSPLTVEEQRSELAAYARLTRQAAARGATVIVWPESAVPGYLQYESALRQAVTALARELRVWLVVGGPSYELTRERARPLQYNSAFAVSPRGEIAGRYDKVHLVPFGEYVPGRDWLPLLRYYRVRDYDIAPGASHHLLGAGGFAFAPMICFESVFPDIARREARMGADALIIITNDAWFLRTAAAAQHLQIGRFRAIEQGLPVVRAASTGVSAFIAPSGRVTGSLGLMKRGLLVSQIRARRADTVYRRIGPAFSVSCAAAAALWVAAALVIRLARRRRGRGPWRG